MIAPIKAGAWGMGGDEIITFDWGATLSPVQLSVINDDNPILN